MIPAVAAALGSGAPAPAELHADWARYVRDFVQDDGRVIDRGRDDLSTSEGQAYALVRAAWCDDRPTFTRVLRWTRDNLQAGHPERLPAWKWGRRVDGTWGVLDEVPASDADQWMAYALLLASERWADAPLRAQAVALIGGIWEEETLLLGERRALLPGRWADDHEPVQLNPSYWLPFAWRRFAVADPAHPWTRLVDDAYALLDVCRQPSGLPPDWCWMDRAGAVTAPPAGREDSLDFGYEAFRLGWTLAAEARWHAEPRARAHFPPFVKLAQQWAPDRPVPARLDASGGPREPWTYPGLVGALLPLWAMEDPRRAEQIWRHDIRAFRDAPPGGREARDYYAHNWVWFGLALWSGLATP